MQKHYAERRTSLPLLLSVNDVVRDLRVSRSFVYGLIRAGDLTPFRVGKRFRFRRDDLEAYLDRHREPGRAP